MKHKLSELPSLEELEIEKNYMEAYVECATVDIHAVSDGFFRAYSSLRLINLHYPGEGRALAKAFRGVCEKLNARYNALAVQSDNPLLGK